MKVSEAIDQLKIGDEAWVKGKIVDVCRGENEKFPVGIELYDDNDWLHKNDEISLTEPTKQVKIPECVGEWIDFCKERGISLHTAMNSHSELLRRIEKTYKEMRKWLTGANYKKHEEIFARAWLDGFTVEPKRWVVKFEQDNEQFFFNSWMHVYSTQPIGYARKEADNVIKFTDKKKAEAVATLVEGSVEEV